ncbi:MAG: 50S ribosomal protein L17 [Deferribacterales bacterium]|jgi:large subunit ribosomal protein L17|uniref:50S ribosomal protein L17 n=1 Tax=Deferrivibrio essentukiensis TaxID=2880922 RepID=UPI0019A0BB2E|nr:50S ribosomal protein L17 [Deferrivibrio essentukiensis]MBC7196379.1 50S ribosomal protein L17 [Deferribacterales bacterium]MBZ4672545.1 rplQ [Deferribacteraceae bacterium]MCB4205096.1 50S ribosomal protein L17 [Deferrivibrio essentukiensis]
MRHRKGGKKLGRPTYARVAMLRNMAHSLVENGRIETTIDRAKTLRGFIEPLITLGKKNTLAARRLALRKLPNKQTVHKIFEEIAPLFKDRNGGYTRVLKTSVRRGDNAQLAIIEFVDKPEKKEEQKVNE